MSLVSLEPATLRLWVYMSMCAYQEQYGRISNLSPQEALQQDVSRFSMENNNNNNNNSLYFQRVTHLAKKKS